MGGLALPPVTIKGKRKYPVRAHCALPLRSVDPAS